MQRCVPATRCCRCSCSTRRSSDASPSPAPSRPGGWRRPAVVSQPFDDLLLVGPQLMLAIEGRPPADFEEFSAAWLARLNLDPEPQPAPEGSLVAANDAPDSVADWRGELPGAGV